MLNINFLFFIILFCLIKNIFKKVIKYFGYIEKGITFAPAFEEVISSVRISE
ncbi:hypothetical protein CCAN2_1910018 [Capnocytophaga canimorsus]|nr:hypothetical protein CCAN2_1910018 [Capnocytophaga canimorsus]